MSRLRPVRRRYTRPIQLQGAHPQIRVPQSKSSHGRKRPGGWPEKPMIAQANPPLYLACPAGEVHGWDRHPRSRKASSEPSGGAPAGVIFNNSEAGSSDQARFPPAPFAYLRRNIAPPRPTTEYSMLAAGPRSGRQNPEHRCQWWKQNCRQQPFW